jgi:L-rhamnose isomerase
MTGRRRPPCRPSIGLHTVAAEADRQQCEVPASSWVVVQSCATCGRKLNEVSKNRGVFLAAGSYVLVYPGADGDSTPEFLLHILYADMMRLKKMRAHEAQLHLKKVAWGSPLFRDFPDMSRHPSARHKSESSGATRGSTPTGLR